MKNIELKLSFLILALLGLTFSSCMHAVMMGSHDSHEGMESTTVTKEVSSGDYTLAVTIPPMETNKDVSISVSLRSKSSIPDSGIVHYMITKSSMDGASTSHKHGTKEDSEEFKPIHQTISIINGTTSFAHKPTSTGQFTLSVETTVDSVVLSTELNFMVHEKKGHGMMGMGADWDYPILGVLAMGAMMITMWAVRGGF
ncbi:MAG: hypothetical protein HUU02_04460 [Bacteroidetes bacterium]|nr:hypothetical protein [Bacteroidota bacterium]